MKAKTPAAPKSANIACICCGVWTPEVTEDTILCDRCEGLLVDIKLEDSTSFNATLNLTENEPFSADLGEPWKEVFSCKLNC
jgi:hypothetical protein